MHWPRLHSVYRGFFFALNLSLYNSDVQWKKLKIQRRSLKSYRLYYFFSQQFFYKISVQLIF